MQFDGIWSAKFQAIMDIAGKHTELAARQQYQAGQETVEAEVSQPMDCGLENDAYQSETLRLAKRC